MENNENLIINLIDKTIEVCNLPKQDKDSLLKIKDEYSSTIKDTEFIVYIAKSEAENESAKEEWYNSEKQNEFLNILSKIIANQTGEDIENIKKTLVNASADSDKSSNPFLSFLT